LVLVFGLVLGSLWQSVLLLILDGGAG